MFDSPDAVFARWLETDDFVPVPRAEPERFAGAGLSVTLDQIGEGLRVRLASEGVLSRVVLRWRRPVVEGALVLGDAWERTYGSQQWRHRQPHRVLPWYWLAYDPDRGTTEGMGVRVRPSAFCAWLVDDAGVALSVDVRNGGSPVRLGPRMLDAATVVAVRGGAGESPWRVHQRLCAAMCDDPRPTRGPVVGANNWYYAYSRFTPTDVLRDAQTIVDLAGGHPVAPYSVVDAGWNSGGAVPGGPWDHGIPGLFDDMPRLAADISDQGARPGVWIRPTALTTVDDESRLRGGPRPAPELPLDLSIAENLAGVAADITRLRDWGFSLIKHDFSTFDLFGRWGFAMGAELTDPGWHLADRTVTNAEVLVGLYQTIADAAGDALILGCNTVGHLAAGLVDIQRTGDDTSGRRWERSRRMGINTLAFRLAQHRTLFTVDADCVPATPQTPWSRNRQLLDLFARSGTALFVSVDARSRTPEVDADLRAALRIALDGGTPGGVEALDWLTTTSPRHWRTGDTETEYDWTDDAGAWPPLDLIECPPID